MFRFTFSTLYHWLLEECRAVGWRFVIPWMTFLLTLWACRYFLKADWVHLFVSHPIWRITSFALVFFVGVALFRFLSTKKSKAINASAYLRLLTLGSFWALALGLNESWRITSFLNQSLLLFLSKPSAHYYAQLLEYVVHAVIIYTLAIIIPKLVGFISTKQKIHKHSAFPAYLGKPEIKKLLTFYTPILIIITPFIIIAGFTPSFLDAYPRLINSIPFGFYDHTPLNIIVFELTYLLQFLALEAFFRGSMIEETTTPLAKTSKKLLHHQAGHYGIWLMAGLYMLIHFHKPPLEALTSIFGGIILGVVAWRTQNIWGGFYLHAGIALLMEFTAGGIYYFSN